MNIRQGGAQAIPYLRAWRMWLGVSMRELAGRAGITYLWLSELERGAVARPETLGKLADALGVSRVALLHVEPEDASAELWASALAPSAVTPAKASTRTISTGTISTGTISTGTISTRSTARSGSPSPRRERERRAVAAAS